MREIVLVRHGIPVCDRATRILGSDFGEWVRKYESASLDRAHTPPARTQARVAEMRCLVTSTLSRSIESAAVLAPGRRTLRDALFDEAGIPTRTRVERIGLATRALGTNGVQREPLIPSLSAPRKRSILNDKNGSRLSPG